MSGGGDGLESASLVRHGSGGRSYTSEGGMLRESEGGMGGSGGGGGGGGGGGVGGGGGRGGGGGGGGEGNLDGGDELDYVESDAPLLSQFHEDAIQQVSMTREQVRKTPFISFQIGLFVMAFFFQYYIQIKYLFDISGLVVSNQIPIPHNRNHKSFNKTF